MTGVPWGLDFNPHTHPILTENLWESPYTRMFSKIGTGVRGAPPVFPLDTPLFRGDVIIATPVTAIEISDTRMSLTEKGRRRILLTHVPHACKTNYKLGCIWRNSNSDYNIYRAFNAFPLNLTSIPKSP